jgi:hypothetical protein
VAQQGSPPGRPPREPGLGRRGHGRERADRADRADQLERPERSDRPERHARADRPDEGYRRERADRRDRPSRPARPPGWSQYDAFDQEAETELPPWAGPLVQPQRAAGTRVRRPAGRVEEYVPPDEHPDVWEGEERPEWPEEEPPAQSQPAPRPGRRSGRRAAAARLRKSRRRVYLWCGVAIVVCVIAATVTYGLTNHSPAKLPYVTSLQKGEFESVPDSCTAVSPAVLNQYLPATGSSGAAHRNVVATQSTSTDSQCSFTVDVKPSFLLLTVGAQSYQPFAAASGDGSASDNALDQFGAAKQTLARPPKKSPLPPATITSLSGLGTQAFLAVALEHVGRIRDDVVTVIALDRNVIITVELTAQDSGGYGPVVVSTLEAGARAAASNVLAKALTQPTA